MSLASYHQACTRMARADYCGDGTSHTQDGTWIEYYDKLIKVKPEVGTGYLNKRIAINRLMDCEKKAQQTAEQDLQTATKDKDQDKITSAQAEVDKHKARIEDLKKQFDEMTKKLTDLAKNPPPAAK